MPRSILMLIMVGVLAAACGGHDGPTLGTTTLPPGTKIVVRPKRPPAYPRHRLGFPLGTYTMARPLAAEGPRTVRTYALATPAQRRALRLAGALGFGETPINFGGNPWRVVREQASLEIWPDSGGRWEYKREQQTSGDQLGSPGERQGLKLAGPVLRAAGLDPAQARVERVNIVTVTLTPRLQGKPTWGWDTEIQVDGRGVSYGVGWLGPSQAGPDRELLTATKAFSRLQEQAARPPQGAKLCPAAYHPRTPPCMRANPAPEVTGARFAYALDWGSEGYQPKLVPAWLFTRRGTQELVAFPA